MNHDPTNEPFTNSDQDNLMSDNANLMQDDSTSLGGDAFSPEGDIDPLSGVSETKKFNAGSLIIVAVIVMACAGLWFMRTLSRVSASTTSNAEIEASIEKFLNSVKQDSLSSSTLSPNGTGGEPTILNVLAETYTDKQVPLDNVQRNPFIIYAEQTPSIESSPTPINDSSRARSQRRTTIEQAAQRFELKSVIISSQPKAILNGKIVMIGDEVIAAPQDIVFVVTDIQSDSVSLLAEDQEMNLKVPVTVLIKRN